MHLNKAQAFSTVYDSSADYELWWCGEIYQNVSDTDERLRLIKSFCKPVVYQLKCIKASQAVYI